MSVRHAKRLKGLVQSDIRYMTRECDRLSGINLGQGLCELEIPEVVTRSARRAIADGCNAYSYPEGVVELRERIASKLDRHNGLDFDPVGDVVVTVGASGAFACTINALLDPGDGILLFEPYYGYHLNASILGGLEPRFMELEPPGFTLDEQRLREACGEGVRAVVLCTPSNPSGHMFGIGELEGLARVAEERDLLVITDEVYEYVRFDGRPHVSPATVAGLRDRTVTISSLSKTFSITGWRLGYAAAPREMARALTLVNDLYYVCAPTPLQHAVAAGFGAPDEYFEGLSRTFESKRERLCSALDEAGLDPIVPEGAYYVLADAAALGCKSSREAAMKLLERTGVASVPGSAFYRGATGERLLRFCFAKDHGPLDEACLRLSRLGA